MIKVFLLLQFAVVATVPCRCVVPTHLPSESVAAADCCRGGSCRAASGDDASAESRTDLSICPRPHRKSACPGRLLPDLAPPPSSPGEELPTLLAGGLSAACDLDAELPSLRASSLLTHRARAAPHFGDQSLLGQHCALIV